jgi:hypothetical protein
MPGLLHRCILAVQTLIVMPLVSLLGHSSGLTTAGTRPFRYDGVTMLQLMLHQLCLFQSDSQGLDQLIKGRLWKYVMCMPAFGVCTFSAMCTLVCVIVVFYVRPIALVTRCMLGTQVVVALPAVA